MVSPILKEAMPVDTGGLISQRIMHLCNDAVTLGKIEHWRRPLTIDSNHRALKLTIGISGDPCDVPVVVEGSSRGCQDVDDKGRQQKKPNSHGTSEIIVEF